MPSRTPADARRGNETDKHLRTKIIIIISNIKITQCPEKEFEEKSWILTRIK